MYTHHFEKEKPSPFGKGESFISQIYNIILIIIKFINNLSFNIMPSGTLKQSAMEAHLFSIINNYANNIIAWMKNE